MQQKLCLWLALAVLFGALCLGNPFLSRSGAAVPLSVPSSAPIAAPAKDPAGERLAASPARIAGGEAAPAALALDARVRTALAIGGFETPNPVEAGRAAVPATLASQKGAGLGADPAAGEARPVACPDLQLAPLVQRTERSTEGTVWVLRDGRRFVRNPRGLVPMLVLATDLKKTAKAPAPGK
jgi:hypothetical protein